MVAVPWEVMEGAKVVSRHEAAAVAVCRTPVVHLTARGPRR